MSPESQQKSMASLRWPMLFLLTVLLGVSFWQAPNFLPEPTFESLPEITSCQLHQQACSAAVPTGGQLIVEMTPKNPAPTDILQLNARFDQMKADSVQVVFEGRDMYMGMVQTPLKSIDVDTGSTFTGQASLSVCIRNVMTWEAIVRYQIDGQGFEQIFLFDTRKSIPTQ